MLSLVYGQGTIIVWLQQKILMSGISLKNVGSSKMRLDLAFIFEEGTGK